MADLSIPFWITTERYHVLVEPDETPCDEPDAPHAFVSAAKLTAFLDARKGGSWKVDLVSDRESLVVAISDLHQKGVTHLCVDPDPDGSGGELVSLAEALALAESQ
jgi:hypothetical protein